MALFNFITFLFIKFHAQKTPWGIFKQHFLAFYKKKCCTKMAQGVVNMSLIELLKI